MLFGTEYDSPLGTIRLFAEDDALIGLYLPDQKVDATLVSQASYGKNVPVLTEGCMWLDRYFHGMRPTPQEILLRPRGSVFRRQIWQRLCRIPYGQLETYGQIAREMAQQKGGKMSAQAVGGAVGHNPISLIIPCHRVIGANGNLVGYGGGLALKKRLLQFEGVDMGLLHDPR